MEVTPQLLGSFPLLRTVSTAELETLAPSCRAEKFSRRGVVLDPNDDDAAVCFLFEGRLQGIDFTLDGREVGLFFVEPGDFCGEMPLFDELARPEYVIALASSLVVKVPTRAIKAIMTENANMMNLLGKKLAVRVKQLTHQRSLLAISNIQQRVCSQLWMLCTDESRKSGNRTDLEAEILNPPTHLEIANMISVIRESVTRVFQTLQNRQIVRRKGQNSLIIISPEALRNLANGD